jgi:hypothetical protein
MSDREKWEFLKRAPLADARTPEITLLASSIRALAAVTPCPNWTVAHLAHALAGRCIPYVLDHDRVGREQIDGFTDPQGRATAALERGADDCDAKARLFTALCLAAGVPARMRSLPDEASVAYGRDLTHVYPEAHLPRLLRLKTGTHEDEVTREWVAFETILARALPGEAPHEVPKETAGNLAGDWVRT